MSLLLADMIATDDACDVYGNATAIQLCQEAHAVSDFQVQWTGFFQISELSFLSVFVVDILLRIYAYGIGYLCDALNFVDAFIVASLFALQARPARAAGAARPPRHSHSSPAVASRHCQPLWPARAAVR